MKAYIKDIAYYLPEKLLTNEQLAAEFPEWSTEKIAGNISGYWSELIILLFIS